MLLFYLIGLLFLSLGLYLLVDAYQFRKVARVVKGKILGFETEARSKGTMYYPVVQYRDGAQVYVFKANIGSNTRSHNLGEDVEVLIVGNDHGNARLKSSARLFLAWVIALFGTVFAGLYILMTANVIALGIALVLTPLLVYLLLYINSRYRTNRAETTSYTPNEEGVVSTVDMDNVVMENTTHDEAASKYADWWMLGIGTVVLCFAFYWYVDTKSLIDVSVKTTGTIVSQKRSSGSDTVTYTPVVMYKPYKHDAVRFEGLIGSSHPSWNIGDAVTVLYDPSNPKRAMIDHGFNYLGPLAMGLFGLFSFAVAYWLYRRKAKFKKLSPNTIFPSK